METEQEKVTRWVKEVLEKQNYEKIVVEFPGYDTSGGYAAEVVFVNVHAENKGKAEKLKLIVKKNKENLALLDGLNIKIAYESETRVYEKLVPIYNMVALEKNSEIFENIPKSYGTICRENEYVIIMENLKSKGFRTHDLEKPFDLNHMKLVLEAYGKWHAFSVALNGENRKILDEFKDSNKVMLEGMTFDLMVKTIVNELDWMIEQYKTKNKNTMLEKMQHLKKIFPDSFADSLRKENVECVVLRHGDSWNNNFLFHYEKNSGIPDKAVIIDWQVAVLGSPTVDLVNFIFMNCSRKELEHLDEFLRLYHGAFSKKLKELGGDPEKSLPWDEYVKSFKRFAPVGLGMVPVAAKMSHKVETGEKYDIAQGIEDGSFAGVLGDTIRDPEGCFDRINGILEFSIEHNYL